MIDWINQIINRLYILPLIYIILIMIALFTVFSFIQTKKTRFLKLVYSVFVLLVVLAIVSTTIVGRHGSDTHRISIIPFVDYQRSNESFRMYVMNAFLFFPYGLFLPYALPERAKHPVRITIFSALFFSLAIETIQLIFRLGICETDDVIMNALGAAIGSFSYILSNWLRKRKEKRKVENT